MMLTPHQYVQAEAEAGRCTTFCIRDVCGESYLYDRDWMPLKSKAYPSRDAAFRDASKIIDRALKAWFRKQ